MTTPKEIIRQHGIRPRKKLGQSFLLDKNIIQKIAAVADISKDDLVLEIGSGIGVLTEEFAAKARRLIAVELDEKLSELLKDKLARYDNVEIYNTDILKFDFGSLSDKYKTKIKVVGNVPYNISSPLIFYLLSYRRAIRDFVLMLQKEVVERLVAAPVNKSYGVPSVILQMFAEVEKVLDVPATCFYPQPKVESAVIKSAFREKPLVALADEEFFIKLVRASFAQRRKMLMNNLKSSTLFSSWTEEKLKNALGIASIDGKRRAETLSVEEFGYLANILKTKELDG
ncbi:MAG TPA: 16S rRNA (adenine(1518)-N(6)/adenine(1519)-N(6))-dimethyltransferase RsmA [Smithellaceae bacterium]|nr:16S rRNA (adenine(1518)-N(6)/adenine(1519)-N(6))-dimethyltransferase RsmA [Smithellaceae bacterium]HRS89963.1 16S rRNA (adenine(1518)-N(6)/adenine(1519)-N(6))-dimethyltransferase RsmA [Smithellaceae bacterium]HRV25857.1 16S rRNA (adenine(1518)-N(6)/adenine(1519)-N(6))-dimethyltransferase RsmA [Smithellaceae bacterium]